MICQNFTDIEHLPKFSSPKLWNHYFAKVTLTQAFLFQRWKLWQYSPVFRLNILFLNIEDHCICALNLDVQSPWLSVSSYWDQPFYGPKSKNYIYRSDTKEQIPRFAHIQLMAVTFYTVTYCIRLWVCIFFL